MLQLPWENVNTVLRADCNGDKNYSAINETLC